MNLLLHRSPAVTPIAGRFATLLLATGALLLLLLIATEMRPWTPVAAPASAPASAPAQAVPGGAPTIFEQVRHDVVTGA